MSDEIFKKIISHAKEYGFVFQSSEIYDGLSAVYDYAQNGVLLKNNIKDYWWKSMVQLNDNIVGIDSAIFSHPTTWKASGHVDAFNDPMIDNKDSKKRYRADNLIEDYIQKIEAKINKEKKKQHKRFGENFDVKTPNTNTLATALSGGNQQKFVVGRELEDNPSLLIASQPTRGIDIGAQSLIWEKLRQSRDNGLAVLLISADLEELIGLSDRIIVFYQGSTVKELSSDDVSPEDLGGYMTGLKK